MANHNKLKASTAVIAGAIIAFLGSSCSSQQVEGLKNSAVPEEAPIYDGPNSPTEKPSELRPPNETKHRQEKYKSKTPIAKDLGIACVRLEIYEHAVHISDGSKSVAVEVIGFEGDDVDVSKVEINFDSKQTGTEHINTVNIDKEEEGMFETSFETHVYPPAANADDAVRTITATIIGEDAEGNAIESRPTDDCSYEYPLPYKDPDCEFPLGDKRAYSLPPHCYENDPVIPREELEL